MRRKNSLKNSNCQNNPEIKIVFCPHKCTYYLKDITLTHITQQTECNNTVGHRYAPSLLTLSVPEENLLSASLLWDILFSNQVVLPKNIWRKVEYLSLVFNFSSNIYGCTQIYLEESWRQSLLKYDLVLKQLKTLEFQTHAYVCYWSKWIVASNTLWEGDTVSLLPILTF